MKRQEGVTLIALAVTIIVMLILAGEIGYDRLRNIVYNKDFEAVPKILETPYIPNPETKKRAFAPYKYEIAMLREGAFHEDLKEKILEGNK